MASGTKKVITSNNVVDQQADWGVQPTPVPLGKTGRPRAAPRKPSGVPDVWGSQYVNVRSASSDSSRILGGIANSAGLFSRSDSVTPRAFPDIPER